MPGTLESSPATLTPASFLTETTFVNVEPPAVSTGESQPARPESQGEGQTPPFSSKSTAGTPQSQSYVPTTIPITIPTTIRTPALPENTPATEVQSPHVIASQTTSPIANTASTATAQQTASLPAPPVLTYGGNTYTALANFVFSLNAGILSPGGPPITHSGTVLSLGPDGSPILIQDDKGSSRAAVLPAPAVFTYDSSTYTALANSVFSLNAGILSPGGPPITDSGKVLSLRPDGAQIIVQDNRGNSTIFLSHVSQGSGQIGNPGLLASASPLVVTASGQSFTIISPSKIAFGGTTLIPGDSGLISPGTPVTFADTGDYLLVGTSSILLGADPSITIGDRTFTANSVTEFTINGQTLVPGGSVVTVNQTTISLAPGATQVVVGSNTASVDLGIGRYIWSGIGGNVQPTSTGTASSAEFSVFTGSTVTETGRVPWKLLAGAFLLCQSLFI